jgi:hypothetical protein
MTYKLTNAELAEMKNKYKAGALSKEEWMAYMDKFLAGVLKKDSKTAKPRYTAEEVVNEGAPSGKYIFTSAEFAKRAKAGLAAAPGSKEAKVWSDYTLAFGVAILKDPSILNRLGDEK